MARRNSPNAIADLGELSGLDGFVFDKRQGQRASAKKHRRNRHYEKQFIRNTLARLPSVEAEAEAEGEPESESETDSASEPGPGPHPGVLAAPPDGVGAGLPAPTSPCRATLGARIG